MAYSKKRGGKSKAAKRDLYQEVTDSIIKALSDGVPPWVRPWEKRGTGSGLVPVNGATGKEYAGINVLNLWGFRQAMGFSANVWMTFKQAQSLGGTVMKGAKSCPVVYWSILEKDKKGSDGKPVVVDGETQKDSIPFMRYSNVFNLEQIEGLELSQPEVKGATEPGEKHLLERVCGSLKVPLHLGGDSAFYRPWVDTISMPERDQFKTAEDFLCTYAHETIHATGHKDRLNREGIVGSHPFGSPTYAEEELVAELGCAFLCAEFGIANGELQHTEYINSWLKKLMSDKKFIFKASREARTAALFVKKQAIEAGILPPEAEHTDKPIVQPIKEEESSEVLHADEDGKPTLVA